MPLYIITYWLVYIKVIRTFRESFFKKNQGSFDFDNIDFIFYILNFLFYSVIFYKLSENLSWGNFNAFLKNFHDLWFTKFLKTLKYFWIVYNAIWKYRYVDKYVL